MPTKSGWKIVDGKAAAEKKKKRKHLRHLREEAQKKVQLEQRVIRTKTGLDGFCTYVVPDFTPLGGNRPDCAVVIASVISLSENRQQLSLPFKRGQQSLVLPPDVLDMAMAVVCTFIVIRSASDVIEPQPNQAMESHCLLSRLEIVAVDGFCNADYNCDFEKNAMPWRNFERVLLQIALPDSVPSAGHGFLSVCWSLVSVDLRHTKLDDLGRYFLGGCTALAEVHLPDTLHTVGDSFLKGCCSLVTIDLRNAKLHTAGNGFMAECDFLRQVLLPDTLQTVADDFLVGCSCLPSIDLRNTKLHTAGSHFMYDCYNLTHAHLPDTLQTVEGPDWSLFGECDRLSAEDKKALMKRCVA